MNTASLLNLPNTISLVRFALSGPVIYLLASGSAHSYWLALGLMLIAEVTDGLDGYLARRFKQVSALGKILDPLADSLYRISVFTALAANHWMPLWMFLIMVWRDVAVSYLRVYSEKHIGTMGARSSGKWKAVAQGAAQIGVVGAHALWPAAIPAPYDSAVWGLLLMATLVTLWSLLDYALSVFLAARRGKAA